MTRPYGWHKGFTVVELLIVIVVVAILVAISIVTFSGVQQNARNTARIVELKQWERLIELYSAREGQDPQITTTNRHYCLGEGFPGGTCWDTTISISSSSELHTALRTVGSLPSGVRTPAESNGNLGPIITYDTGRTYIQRIWTFLEGNGTCPSGVTAGWRGHSEGRQVYRCDIVIAP